MSKLSKSLSQKKWVKNNREKVGQIQKNWQQKHKNKISEYGKHWRLKNKDKIKLYNQKYAKTKRRLWAERNKDKIKNWNKQYGRNHPEVLQRLKKKFYEQHPGKSTEYVSRWRNKYPEKNRAINNAYQIERLKTDPKFRLDHNTTNLIYFSLRSKKAGRKWQDLVGYSLKDLMNRLEKTFDDKMNWDNYGNYWHVDHIRPRSSFKYFSTDDEEFKKCWALKNLQALEGKENIRKGDKY